VVDSDGCGGVRGKINPKTQVRKTELGEPSARKLKNRTLKIEGCGTRQLRHLSGNATYRELGAVSLAYNRA